MDEFKNYFSLTPNFSKKDSSGSMDEWTKKDYQEAIIKLRRYIAGLKQILEVSKILLSEISFDNLIECIMDNVTKVLVAERSTLYLLDAQEKMLFSSIAQGTDNLLIKLPVGKGIAGYVGKKGEILNIPDAYKNSHFDSSYDKKSGFRTRSVLCAPIKNNKNKVIGVIQVLNKIHPGEFSEDDEDLIKIFCEFTAKALSNARVHGEAEIIERKDSHIQKILNSIPKED
ncbi:GAF domain-containing protein [Candidatus Riflebacteria bacterium]